MTAAHDDCAKALRRVEDALQTGATSLNLGGLAMRALTRLPP